MIVELSSAELYSIQTKRGSVSSGGEENATEEVGTGAWLESGEGLAEQLVYLPVFLLTSGGAVAHVMAVAAAIYGRLLTH